MQLGQTQNKEIKGEVIQAVQIQTGTSRLSSKERYAGDTQQEVLSKHDFLFPVQRNKSPLCTM